MLGKATREGVEVNRNLRTTLAVLAITLLGTEVAYGATLRVPADWPTINIAMLLSQPGILGACEKGKAGQRVTVAERTWAEIKTMYR